MAARLPTQVMPTHAELASLLLTSAAELYEVLDSKEPALTEKMQFNAEVFRRVGELVREDPAGVWTERGTTTFETRPRWINDVVPPTGLPPGDRPYFPPPPGVTPSPSWEVIPTKDRPELLASLGLYGEKELEDVHLTRCRPRFARGVCLLHAAKGDTDGLFAESLVDGHRHIESFDFGLELVHQLYGDGRLQLAGHEADYFRLLMYLIRGEKGGFRVVEGLILDYARQVLQAVEPSLSSKLQPPSFSGLTDDGTVLYHANIIYDRRLFEALFGLRTNGGIDMLHDKSIGGPYSDFE